MRSPNKNTAENARYYASWVKIISDAMKDAGLSEARLADKAGIDRRALKVILAGASHITLPNLERVLLALGYELDAIKVTPSTPIIRKRTRPIATRCNGEGA